MMIWWRVFFVVMAGINTAMFVVTGAWYNAGVAVAVGLAALMTWED